MTCPRCGTSVTNGSSVCTTCGSGIGTLFDILPKDSSPDSMKSAKEAVKRVSYEVIIPEPPKPAPPTPKEEAVSAPTAVEIDTAFEGEEELSNVISDIVTNESGSTPSAESTKGSEAQPTSDTKPAADSAPTSPAAGKKKGGSKKKSKGGSSAKSNDSDDALSRDIESMLESSKTSEESETDSDMGVSAADIESLLGNSSEASDKDDFSDEMGVSASDIEALLGGTEMQSSKGSADTSHDTSSKATTSASSGAKKSGSASTSGARKASSASTSGGTSARSGSSGAVTAAPKTATTTAPKTTTTTAKTTPVTSTSTSSSPKYFGNGNLGTVGIIQSVIASVLRMFNFHGRSSRSEFCWGMPFLFAIVYLITANTNMGFIATIAVIATMIAMTSLSVRRLHDIGKSWVGLWKLLIPYIGMVWLLFQLIFTPSEGKNRWGKDNH